MDVGSMADYVLFIIKSLSKNLGDFVKFEDIQNNLPKEQTFAERELKYILNDYLMDHSRYLEIAQPSNKKYKITPAGYAYLHKLITHRKESNIGFCAMWFNKDMGAIWENAIKPAIEESGYQAFRIDEHHHNNDINAEIIANLNKSKFIVADFTGNRGGVYFEAGYAKGKNIEVIYTCNKNEFENEKPHFDVAHYNFITWENSSLEKFKSTLKDRIIQTIPSGKTKKE